MFSKRLVLAVYLKTKSSKAPARSTFEASWNSSVLLRALAKRNAAILNSYISPCCPYVPGLCCIVKSSPDSLILQRRSLLLLSAKFHCTALVCLAVELDTTKQILSNWCEYFTLSVNRNIKPHQVFSSLLEFLLWLYHIVLDNRSQIRDGVCTPAAKVSFLTRVTWLFKEWTTRSVLFGIFTCLLFQFWRSTFDSDFIIEILKFSSKFWKQRMHFLLVLRFSKMYFLHFQFRVLLFYMTLFRKRSWISNWLCFVTLFFNGHGSISDCAL